MLDWPPEVGVTWVCVVLGRWKKVTVRKTKIFVYTISQSHPTITSMPTTPSVMATAYNNNSNSASVQLSSKGAWKVYICSHVSQSQKT